MPLATVRAMIGSTGMSPRCACGGLVKAAIISFGERIPEEALQRATAAALDADLFLVVGSSLRVQPAAALPIAAMRGGASLAIINRDPTPLDQFAEVVLHRSIGAVFSTLYPQLVAVALGSV
jgi:NAD-dependent deacetylase